MFPVQEGIRGNGMNGEDNYYVSDDTETVHITVNSREEGSING